jgi:hypothetical protein
MVQTNINTNTNTKNVLPDFKTPTIFFPFILMIILLIIFTILIIFHVKITGSSDSTSSTTKQEITADVFLLLFIAIIIVVICVMFLDNLKDLKDFFIQTPGVLKVILYTMGLIMFFRLVSKDTLNNYAYIITPITLLTTMFVFYNTVNTNYVEEFNINYERIKSLILFFCFITTLIVYYSVDPGGYISKYFGSSLIITILIAVFSFLYLIIFLTLPNTLKSVIQENSDNFLGNFSHFSVYGSILFLVFLAFITFTISTYPGGFFNDASTSTAVMILVLMICILWSILLGAVSFPEISDKPMNLNKLSLFKRALLTLFGLIISSLLICWIVYNLQSLSENSSTVSFMINILLVLVVLALIYRALVIKAPGHHNAKKNSFVDIIISLIFYIPCLFSGFFDLMVGFLTNEYKSTDFSSLLLLILAVLLITVYFTMPSVFNKINLQGGDLLVNQPVSTDTIYSLGTYKDLNGSDTFDYQYAISSWIFLDSAAPNMNPSYSKYTSLLNFGEKPNILYNGSTNTLMITMQQKDLEKTTGNKLIDFTESGNRIIYKNHGMLLQKWNNIIINYNGGVLDIFLNGELVKSEIGVVPYYTLDNLTIGQENGIKGGICSVVYFKRALTNSNIYFLYNMIKDKKVPVVNDSNVTITHKDITTTTQSF